MQIPADASARSSSSRLGDWWKLRGRGFLGTLALTSLAVVVSGWLTGLRTVMHGALLSLATIALLPYLLMIGAMLVLTCGGLMLHPHGIAELVATGGEWFASRYYRFVASRRHPLFWGVPVGVLLGALILWALIAAILVPGEARTVRIFAQTEATLAGIYRDTGEFPRPDAQGHLAAPSSAGHAATTAVLVDGFGRPVHYELTRRWKLSSWVLVSSGFDGQPSADDLCLSGGTKLGVWAGRASELAHLLWIAHSKTASLNDELLAIRALSCPAR